MANTVIIEVLLQRTQTHAFFTVIIANIDLNFGHGFKGVYSN